MAVEKAPGLHENGPLVEYRNVTVMRDGRVVLESINLRLGAGEHVAVLGPNGSGKSTLIKTIMRELYPLAQPGSCLRIFGRDVWNVSDLRPLFGLVSNDFIKEGPRRLSTIREMVLSGFFGSVGIWPNHEVTAEMEQKAEELMKRLEISHLADRNSDEVSSGEARRVLIARALVHNPRALVLDEPTNSLDFNTVRHLRATLSRIATDGTGLILVTHHLDDIIPEVTRVIMLNHGRIVGDGPKHEMLTSERLSMLFGMRVDVKERDGHFHLW